MRTFVLRLIAACFYYCGLVQLTLWWQRHTGKRLVILNYHRASGGDLRRHWLYLCRHYRLLHLEAALEELYTPHKGRKKIWDRRTPLVLTFDDGYHDNYTHAFALACELQVPITMFLIPGYIESGDRFWWLESKRIAHHAKGKEAAIEGRIYHPEHVKERRALTLAIDTRLRYAGSVLDREAYLSAFRTSLATPMALNSDDDDTRPLTWTEIREMEGSGWVSFGSHTMHHHILTYLANSHEIQHEVTECRTMLEQQLGHPVRTFAYPVGKKQHLKSDVVQAVQQAGYDWALTTLYGFNTPKSNPYLLRRVEVAVTQHWLVMAVEAAGLWGFFSHLRWVPFVRKHFTNTSWN